MTFWNDMALEPYRGFRWVIEFSGIGQKFYAMKCDKPSFKVGEYTHKYLNHSFFFPGRVEWNPVTVTLVDVPNGAAKEIMAHMRGSGYMIPAGQDSSTAKGTDGLTKAAHSQSHATAGRILIKQLSPTGETGDSEGAGTHRVTATYTLANAWILDVKLGSLDYSSEDAVTMDLTIRYDWATMHSAMGH